MAVNTALFTQASSMDVLPFKRGSNTAAYESTTPDSYPGTDLTRSGKTIMESAFTTKGIPYCFPCQRVCSMPLAHCQTVFQLGIFERSHGRILPAFARTPSAPPNKPPTS